MKYKVACLFAIAVAGMCLATSQNSSRPTSAKPGQDPLQDVNKPLTPKSAMPSARKSPAAVPAPATGTQKTNQELSRLEREKAKAGSSDGSRVTSNGSSVPKATSSNSAINFKYKKPAGGLKAPSPDGNTRNSSTPRVSKKN
jgi:hypothetical protein